MKLKFVSAGILLAFLAIPLLPSCNDSENGPDVLVDATPNCTPQPVANLGGDKFVISDEESPLYSPSVQIGTKEISGMSYLWEPKDGLSDSGIAEPIATPKTTTVYKLTVTSKCGTAKGAMTVHVLDDSEFAANGDFVISHDNEGKAHKYPTGYKPLPINFLKNYRGTTVYIPKAGWASARGDIPLSDINFTPPNFLVNSQPEGSCWAEGASSAGTANLFKFFKKTNRVSAQRIIDCSGFGSASGGGEISIDDFLMPTKGFVYTDDYPYNGHDHACSKEKSVFREQAKRTFEIASETGGSPSPEDHLHAMLAFGVPEVCGAAASLNDGGWVTRPGGGQVNHCYARFSALRGELHGYPAGWYKVEQNSWGTSWGGGKDLYAGQGAYRWTDETGKEIKSNVETEHKYMEMNNPCPPPVVDPGEDRTILLAKGFPHTVPIGSKAIAGQSYSWAPADTLYADASLQKPGANLAEPVAAPIKTTQYTVTVKNSCGTASGKMQVHVYHDVRGESVEVVL